MTFKDIAVKNFKANIKKYLSYFLCSGFSIMIFFIYASLLFNKSVNNGDDQNAVEIIFGICLVLVALFAVFFISYAHTAFIKSRYKEFGLYMTLGMTTKNIQSLILIENLLIIASSFIGGLVTGLIFSRLFQMIVVQILDIKGFSYSISALSFILTIGIFVLVFAFVLTVSRVTTARLKINELIKKPRQNEAKLKARVIPGAAGIVLLFASLAVFVYISNYEKLNSNFALVISVILLICTGVYLTISFAGITILAFIKRRKGCYYKNLLPITEILSKFNQNRRIIFVLSILSSMIVFFVASPFSMRSLSEKIAEMSEPRHLEYAELDGVNSIPEAQLKSIVSGGSTKLTGEYSVEFLALRPQKGLSPDNNLSFDDKLGVKPVVSQSAYNRATGSQLSVPDGTVFNAITEWMPGTFGINQGASLSLVTGSGTAAFKVIASQKAPWIASPASFPSSSGLVVSDADYARLKSQTQAESVGTVHVFSFDNWKRTANTAASLRLALAAANAQAPAGLAGKAVLFQVSSRLDTYNMLKRYYSMFMFVETILGLLFFIAAGSVLFFKQYTELSEDRVKFRKLFKLGITKREAQKVITKELTVTFFTPLIFGSLVGYALIYYMTHLVGGQQVMSAFMQNCTKVVIAYFVFQALFFAVTRKKYISEVLG